MNFNPLHHHLEIILSRLLSAGVRVDVARAYRLAEELRRERPGLSDRTVALVAAYMSLRQPMSKYRFAKLAGCNVSFMQYINRQKGNSTGHGG